MPAKKAPPAARPAPKRPKKLYHWTEKDLDDLKRLYAKASNEEIAKKLKRSKSSVDKKAHELALRKDPAYRSTIAAANNARRRNSWRNDEISQLKKLYSKHTYAELAKILGRNAQSIQSKATRLGLWKYRTEARTGT